MNGVTEFFNWLLSQLNGDNFPWLAVLDFCAFGVVFLASLIGCIFSKKVRAHGKHAFLCVVNLFTALTLAVFLTCFTLAQSLAVSAVFWCAGYLLYGALCLFRVKPSREAPRQVAQISAMPVNGAVRRTPSVQPEAQPVPAGASVVRLEHALSIADKLLLKNLGRGDRQELEKIKTSLTVLKVKGILSAQEGEALNDMFNALLKLMAKYDL